MNADYQKKVETIQLVCAFKWNECVVQLLVAGSSEMKNCTKVTSMSELLNFGKY